MKNYCSNSFKDFKKSYSFDFFEKLYIQLAFSKKNEVYENDFNLFFNAFKEECNEDYILMSNCLTQFAKDCMSPKNNNFFLFGGCNNF